jgi:hypothetical protein
MRHMRSLRELLVAAGLSLTVSFGCDDGLRSPHEDGGASLQIKGTFDNCPVIKSIVVSPSTVTVGQSSLVTVTATDRDPGDVLTFSWAAPVGTFADMSRAATSYACTSSGAQVLSVKVSDGRCDSQGTVAVTCRMAP